MQKKHLMAGSAIGGFLLATTALTSAASAQTLLASAPALAANFGGTFATETFAGIAGSGVTVGSFDVVYNLGGDFQNGTVRLQIDTNIGSFLTGLKAANASAGFSGAAATSANANVVDSLGSLLTSVTVSSVSAFGGQISVTYVTPSASAVQSLLVESLKLAQVQGLSAAGTALTLTTSLFAGDSTTSSASDSLTIGTSASVHSASVATAGTLTANATATPPFAGFVGNGSTLVGTLATINVVGVSAQSNTLATALATENLVSAASGLNVTVTSELLTQSGLTRAQVVSDNSASTTSTATVSTGAISDDGTFTVTSVEPNGGFNDDTTSVLVQAVFDGATAITTAEAGTVSATLIGTTTSVLATASGATAAVVRNGILAEVNFFQGAGDSFGGAEGAFQSFLRISNSGTVAGAATISAVDADGVAVGSSFTTAEIPVNGQLQLSNIEIEAGIGAVGATGQYSVFITGPFQGYVQHVQLNNTNSGFTNLSGFRGNSATANTIP